MRSIRLPILGTQGVPTSELQITVCEGQSVVRRLPASGAAQGRESWLLFRMRQLLLDGVSASPLESGHSLKSEGPIWGKKSCQSSNSPKRTLREGHALSKLSL